MFDRETKETNRLLAENGHTLRRIELLLTQLLTTENKIIMDLTQLTAAVARNGTVEASAVTLLQGLKGQLDAAIEANRAGDPTALAALSTALGSETDSLAAAIVANTPAPAAVVAAPVADALPPVEPSPAAEPAQAPVDPVPVEPATAS